MNLEKVLKKVTSERSKGEHQKALDHLQKALKQDPKEYRLYHEAALCCFDMGNTLDALNYVKTAISRFPQHRQLARDLCRDEFDRGPDPILGNFLLDAYVQRREFDEARLLAANFPSELSSSLIKRLTVKKGNVARSLGKDGSNARSSITNLLYAMAFIQLGDKNATGYAASLGEILNYNKEEVANVGKLLKDAERKFKNVASIRFYLGRAYLQTQRPEKGLPKYLEALVRDEKIAARVAEDLQNRIEKEELNNPLARMVWGEALVRNQDVDKGAAMLTRFLRENQDKAELVCQRLEQLGDDLRADPTIQFLQAEAFLSAQKAARSATILESLCKRNDALVQDCLDWLEYNEKHPGFTAELLQLKAKYQVRLGKMDEALETFDTLSHEDLTQVEWMISVLEEARKNDDADPGVLQRLANLYAIADRPGDAQNMLRKFQETVGDDSAQVGEISRTIIESCGVTFQACVSLLKSSLDDGDLDPAIDHLLRLAQERPEDMPELAQHLLDLLDRNERTLEVIKALLDNFEEPLPEAFKFMQAVVMLRTGNVEMGVFQLDQILLTAENESKERALEEYRKVLAKVDDNLTLNLAYFTLLLELFRFDEACETAIQVLALDPHQAEHVLTRLEREIEMEEANLPLWENLVASLVDIKLYQAAETLCDRLAETLPESSLSLIYHCRGDLALQEGCFDDALECYSRALMGGGVRPDRMITSLEKFLQIHPDHSRAHLYLADALATMKDVARATHHYEKAAVGSELEAAISGLGELSGSWQASFALGKIFAREGDLSGARKFFGACRGAPPEAQEAIEKELRKLWKDSSDKAGSGIPLAHSLAGQGKIDDAISVLEEVFASDPGTAPGVTHEVIAIREVEPKHLPALRLLARIRLSQGQTDEAREMVVEIGESFDQDPAFCSAALKEFENAFEDDVEISLLRARALSSSGNPHDALELFESLLEKTTRGDPADWNVHLIQAVLPTLKMLAWPDELRLRAKFLGVDCLLAIGSLNEAESELRALSKEVSPSSDEILERLEWIIESGNSSTETVMQVSDIYLSKDRGEEAVELLRRAAVENRSASETTKIKLALASALRESGAEEESDALFAEILATSKEADKILRELEEITLREGSRKLFELKLRWERSELESREALDFARMTFDAGEIELTRSVLGKTRFQEDQLFERQVLLARTYMEEERFALALNILTAHCNRNAEDSALALEAEYAKAICFEKLNRWGDAYRTLADVIAREPGYRDADKRVRYCYSNYLEDCRGTGAVALEKSAALESVLESAT